MSIKVLPPDEARKIAAGEVLDRPAALCRELLDNAIDAGAKNIELNIEEGGIKLVEVIDDGEGMSRQDLSVCHLTHATSKIRSLDDLLKISTLGFRGEALAAAAAVSSLEILSSRDGREAWRLRVGPGEEKRPILEQNSRNKGSSIKAMGLFDNIPARKRFLKKSGHEAEACRQILLEKAMAFPSISFRYSQDGKVKLLLDAVPSHRERFCQIYLKEEEKNFLYEIYSQNLEPDQNELAGSGFSLIIIAGGPELSRRDRSHLFVFANNRRIRDYGLLQAFEYGLEQFFPGGNHPIGAVFVNIDPALADFNIHPAKREVRFKDASAIHHAISSTIRDFFRRREFSLRGENQDIDYAPSAELEFLVNDSLERSSIEQGSAEHGSMADRPVHIFHDAHPLKLPAFEKQPDATIGNIANSTVESKYIGRLFDLFILIERGERFFIVDQHAAHEAILYNGFIKEPIAKQELLVSIAFETESEEEDNFLEKTRDELSALGIDIERENSSKKGLWHITALPSGWKLSDEKTISEIKKLQSAGDSFARSWMISLSCWGAVKDGNYLDDHTALLLAEEAFRLPFDRCPHGRPIWHEISRNELLKAVKRI